MSLKKEDPKTYQLIEAEINRQKMGISLIASENYASPAVLKAVSSPLTNKYAEGYPGKRYYGGNEFVDQVESLAIERAKKLFKADHANVQPHSGSQANAAVYLGLLKPGDKILGFDLKAGGHLTHGSPVNFSGQYYQFEHYGVDKQTEMIDFDKVREIALKFKPKLIVASTTAYSRIIDFKKFREIADEVNAYLMGDISHIAGLVVTGLHPHPFPHCDVVTTTTHKTLRGPRGAIILCKQELAKTIDRAVFPGNQGGPLEHVIAGKAVSFLEAMKKSFQAYQENVILNTQAMVNEFKKQGMRIVSRGTDNHLFVIDISDFDLDSKEIQNGLEEVNIYVNKNTIPFDQRSPFNPSGIRIGSPAMTTRGMKEREARKIVQLIMKLINNFHNQKNREEVKEEVKKMCLKFPIYKGLKW
jgi:glycine hydroxymethyltransferase